MARSRSDLLVVALEALNDEALLGRKEEVGLSPTKGSEEVNAPMVSTALAYLFCNQMVWVQLLLGAPLRCRLNQD